MHTWIAVGGVDIGFGIMLDQLTAIMLIVVSGVSFLVQIYGIGYMHGDDGYTRYFAYMALFTASMLGLSPLEALFSYSCSGNLSVSRRIC